MARVAYWKCIKEYRLNIALGSGLKDLMAIEVSKFYTIIGMKKGILYTVIEVKSLRKCNEVENKSEH